MRRNFLWVLGVCLWLWACKEERDIIRSVVAIPPTVRPGGSAVISVDANRRPSGATVTGGTIATPAKYPFFLWVAPQEEGDYQLTVQVGKAIATLLLPVRESEDKEPPQPPPQVFVSSRCQEFVDSSGSTKYVCTVTVSWLPATDNVGVIGYRLYRNGILYWVAVGNQFIDQNVKVGKNYTYGVQAFDAVGNASEIVMKSIEVD